jgi:nucleotide-binding universal stress UspA family protein
MVPWDAGRAADHPIGEAMQVRSILVPVDFSRDSEHATGIAAELAKTFGAKLLLLHAYHLPTQLALPDQVIAPQDYWDGVRDATQRKLEDCRARASASGVDADVELVAGAPSFAISETAKRVNADLIVMGTRGLTGLKHVLLGSTAERTVRLAPCPVMTVKAGEETESPKKPGRFTEISACPEGRT